VQGDGCSVRCIECAAAAVAVSGLLESNETLKVGGLQAALLEMARGRLYTLQRSQVQSRMSLQELKCCAAVQQMTTWVEEESSRDA
jgi:hypothetical protein